jgi:hypothetical protein
MTDTMTYQNIDLSYWDILYTYLRFCCIELSTTCNKTQHFQRRSLQFVNLASSLFIHLLE